DSFQWRNSHPRQPQPRLVASLRGCCRLSQPPSGKDATTSRCRRRRVAQRSRVVSSPGGWPPPPRPAVLRSDGLHHALASPHRALPPRGCSPGAAPPHPIGVPAAGCPPVQCPTRRIGESCCFTGISAARSLRLKQRRISHGSDHL